MLRDLPAEHDWQRSLRAAAEGLLPDAGAAYRFGARILEVVHFARAALKLVPRAALSFH